MSKKSSRAKTVSDWLAAVKRMPTKKGGSKCHICSNGHVLHGVTYLAGHMAQGDIPRYSFAHIARVVSEETGESVKAADIIRHLENHQPDIMNQLRERHD